MIPNENFCVAPWVHFMVNPDGHIGPCCLVNPEFHWSYGSVNDDDFDIDKIMNNEIVKKIRRDFMAGITPHPCKICKASEVNNATHYRRHLNEHWFNDDLLKNTKPDGTYENFELKYADIRTSNVCNLSCIICGNSYSFGAGALRNKLYGSSGDTPVRLKYDRPEVTVEIFKRYIKTIKRIMFAGGEISLDPHHLEILDLLEENEKFDVQMFYQLNMQKISIGDVYLPDRWKKFDQVEVCGSIDGCGKTFEYIRYGGNWEKTVENLKALIKYPNIDVRFNIVVQFFNFNNIPILIDELEKLFPSEYVLHLAERCMLTRIYGDDYQLELIPKEYIDIKAWESLKERGYMVDHILDFIYSDYSATEKQIMDITFFMKRYKEISGLDAKDIIPYYHEFIKD